MYISPIFLTPFPLIYFWAWNAPARDLKIRRVVGAARTTEEIQKIGFAKLPYQRLAQVPVLAGLLLYSVWDMLHGWGLLWLILPAGMVAGAGVQAFRKWHYERE